ncbi:MAG: acyltransferase [Lachnospiraceae bacterium]|nr:acyltransferase [Lachnospiraceae bacterium]
MVSKRQTNFELLRIVAMLMIITLHYIVKGFVVTNDADRTLMFYAMRLIEAFCIVAVNCYVLISGYFLVESEWKAGRIISLLTQVLFYSLLIPVAMICIGMLSWSDLGNYDWIGFILPIETEHYWFATAYVIMYIFAPVLAAGAKSMDKKTLQKVILVLLLFLSVGKSVFPIYLETDKYGYNYGWFLVLFLVAAYLRLYCPEWLKNRGNAISIYVSSSLGIFALSLIANLLGKRIDAFSYYWEMPYTYNHILCLIGSIGLFCAFKNTKIREGKAAGIIRRLAPYTFGVYLLHEHILVRYKWPAWLQVESVRSTWRALPHMIGCVVVIYLLGTLVDFIRAYFFERVMKVFKKRDK